MFQPYNDTILKVFEPKSGPYSLTERDPRTECYSPLSVFVLTLYKHSHTTPEGQANATLYFHQSKTCARPAVVLESGAALTDGLLFVLDWAVNKQWTWEDLSKWPPKFLRHHSDWSSMSVGVALSCEASTAAGDGTWHSQVRAVNTPKWVYSVPVRPDERRQGQGQGWEPVLPHTSCVPLTQSITHCEGGLSTCSDLSQAELASSCLYTKWLVHIGTE